MAVQVLCCLQNQFSEWNVKKKARTKLHKFLHKCFAEFNFFLHFCKDRMPMQLCFEPLRTKM